MQTDWQNPNILYPPRSTVIFLVQYFAVVPLGTVLTILFAVGLAMSDKRVVYGDLVILILFFILPLLFAGFLMLYLPERYRTGIILDGDTKNLQKIKKGTLPQQFNLSNAQVMVAKTIKTIPGCKFTLAIEDLSGGLTPIFKEDTNPGFGAKHWQVFASRLAEMAGLPLKTEYYLEQMDGSLAAISFDEIKANKRRALPLIFLPLIISFQGALVYSLHKTTRMFFLAGGATVVVNMILSFLLASLYKRKVSLTRDIDMMTASGDNKIILIAYILTLVIPYSFYYLFCVSLLSGFRWPFY
jgi:hypothetical protein